MSHRTQPSFIVCDTCGNEKEFKLTIKGMWLSATQRKWYPEHSVRRDFCAKACLFEWMSSYEAEQMQLFDVFIPRPHVECVYCGKDLTYLDNDRNFVGDPADHKWKCKTACE